MNEFISALGSSAPVPGGGGAAGLVGSAGAALAAMAARLSSGKKKTDADKLLIDRLTEKADLLSRELLLSIDRDADCFLPLSRAYSMPKDSDERKAAIEAASVQAASAPLEALRLCCSTVDLLEALLPVCSRLLISDVACAAACTAAAIRCCLINVLVNTASLKSSSAAAAMEKEAAALSRVYIPRAEKLFEAVSSAITG